MNNPLRSRSVFSGGGGVILLLAILLTSTASKAQQCPNDVPPISSDPNYMPWNGPQQTTYIIPGTTCQVNVTYCYRTVFMDPPFNTISRYQAYVSEFNFSITGCDNLSFLAKIDAVSEATINTAPFFPCDEYPWGKMTKIMPICWQLDVDGRHYLPICDAGGAKCLMTFDYCHDEWASTAATANIIYTELGVPLCPALAPGAVPAIGECFKVECGARP